MSQSTNAVVETVAERTARHMHQCQRLAELGMMLAEAAAARAQMAFARLPPGPGQEDEAAPRAPHPATLFTQLASVVRHAITLECRIAAGRGALAPQTQADPRRAKIRRAIRQATQGRFGRADLLEEADELLEAELALDPDGTTSLPDLLATICEDLGFELDYEKLQAELAAPGSTSAEDAGQPEWSHGAQPRRPPH